MEKPKYMNIPLKDVIFRKKYYPRLHPDFVTLNRYNGAFRAGARFPPITVLYSKEKKKYILLDGYHRSITFKSNKQKTIPAEVYSKLSEKEAYIVAVQKNMSHGRQFTVQEITNVMLTLKQWKLSLPQISALTMMPIKEIEPFMAKRIARVGSSSKPDERIEVALKAPLQSLAGTEQVDLDQTKIIGRQQVQMLDSVISLCENGWLNTESALVMEKVKKLKQLLKRY